MKHALTILFVVAIAFFRQGAAYGQAGTVPAIIDFYGEKISLPVDSTFQQAVADTLSVASIQDFYTRMLASNYQPLVQNLLTYKKQSAADDWLYYQLIRAVSQLISPKQAHYARYTLYKWFLLSASGYDAILTVSNQKLLFYVRSDENIYNIPTRMQDGKQYVCLNYHDLVAVDFGREKFLPVPVHPAYAQNTFSYRIRQLPNFDKANYISKDIRFNYNEMEYHFKVKLNPQVKTIFANYPVVDYASYLNIPLSRETYNSLIPLLKKNVKGLNIKNGVDYLMRFTRYAFMYEADLQNFGGEKRLSPEQTLLYDNSDCEDRVGLFFFLVKEIYDLPMIVLAYPKHVTIAVKFDRPFANSIVYNGVQYSVCEPTPQKNDLALGQLAPSLKNTAYEVAYVYTPAQK